MAASCVFGDGLIALGTPPVAFSSVVVAGTIGTKVGGKILLATKKKRSGGESMAERECKCA